ncbi:MAG: uroporphyrinogen decarboxylase [Candidatus Omnitrophota bacterium]
MMKSTLFKPASQELSRKERFLNAISFAPIDRPPVWLMRQAGRYLPEYQEVKRQYSFQEMCRLPSVAADVSLQPFDILGVDAIIVFNDILIPLESMGFSVEYAEGGPIVAPAIRRESDWKSIRPADFSETPPVFDSIREIRKRAGSGVPILGFAGSPFTLATYIVEGGVSRNLRYIKEIAYAQPQWLERMLELITPAVIEYLKIQIQAGADAVQIFDTWAGTLQVKEYRRFALPYQRRIVEAIQSQGTPVILYVKGSSPYLREMKETGAAVLSVDWITPLREVAEIAGEGVALQGNLDPAVLYAAPETVREQVQALLRDFGRKQGYIFNLGHGVLPETPVESVKEAIKAVKDYE